MLGWIYLRAVLLGEGVCLCWRKCGVEKKAVTKLTPNIPRVSAVRVSIISCTGWTGLKAQ